MGKWEEGLIITGFSKKEIEIIRKSRSEGGKKGGTKKGPKGLRMLDPEKRRLIQSMGGKARAERLKYAD